MLAVIVPGVVLAVSIVVGASVVVGASIVVGASVTVVTVYNQNSCLTASVKLHGNCISMMMHN